MKLFIFQCRKQRHMFAASRYETGSNLPADRCDGGWEFFELVYLSRNRTPQIPVDVHELRHGLHQQGWYVWETKSHAAGERIPAIPEVTPPISVALIDMPPSPAAPEHVVAPPAASKPTPVVTPPSPRPAHVPTPPPPRPAPIAPPPPPQPVPVATPTTSKPAHVPAPPPSTPVPVGASPAVVQPAATPPGGQETVAPRPAHQVVWFDIPVLDLERAVRFYSVVLGAPLETVQAGFGMSMALLPHAEGAITGCLVQTTDAKPSEGGPLLYLNTQGRLDEAVAAAQMNGGTVVQPRHSIGSAGSRAIVIDSEGNRIALHST